MNDLPEQSRRQSRLEFQMWDKHLTALNNIWDVETLLSDKDAADKPKTRFHTTLWDRHLLQLNRAWHVSSTLTVQPPSSLIHKLLLPVKKLILRWIQPAIDTLVQQQNDFNAQVVQTCNGIVETVNNEVVFRLEAQKEFNARVVQTINYFVELVGSESASSVQELEMMLWTLDRRKEALEIDQILLNQKLEQVLSILRNRPELSQEKPAGLPETERQNDYKYVVFENLYRGDEATIKQRQQAYLQYFQGCSQVLDVGCGRGEFLELLNEQNISGYGIDMNQAAIQYCRKKNLTVEEADVFAHLQSLAPESLGGIFAGQVIEHLAPVQMSQFLHLCLEKLRPQAYLVIETQNPTSLYALSHFYRDLSHEKPVHPDALHYLLKTCGFREVRIEYATPFSKELALKELDSSAIADENLRNIIAALNADIRQLNDAIYGHLDYAAIAQK